MNVDANSNGAAVKPRGMLSKLLSLLGDVAVYGISSLLSQLIGFLLLPLYTRYLSPADQGLVAMVVTVTTFFGPLANLGMTNAIFRRFNLEKGEQERGRTLSTGLISVTVSSLVLLGVTMIFAGPIASLCVRDADAVNLVRANLLCVAVSAIGLVPLAVLRAGRRVKTTAIINVSKLLISVGSTLWLVVGLEWGVWGVIVGTLIGESVITTVLFAITARSFRHGFDYATWKRLRSYGFPLVPHQLQAMALGLVGQYAVGSMLGFEEAGLYSLAIRLSLPITFIVNSTQSAWVAFKFQIHAEDPDPPIFFRTAFTYYVGGLCYLWVGVALWGPELVWLLTDKTYFPAAYLIPIVSFLPVSQGLFYMMGTGMEMSDDTRPYPLVSLTGLIVATLAIFLLVKPLGAAGAAIASACAFLSMAVVLYRFSQQRLRIPYDWPTIWVLLAITIGSVAAARVSLALPIVPRLALAVFLSLAFPLIEFGILLRSATERHRMRVLWTRLTKLPRRRGAKTSPNVETVAVSE